ncbi:hypothetical protein NEIMUCOT_03965 [Neisseria mucosa ATCC 25996]|uniref:Uncharacterized protein n=1 Tax=Neisseria mucosa (strain ATCC 25996 / DSM 4631 / NCTC 10774 / M26) TaxID=546266 RepID=D2ZTM8_NEIM2|nr:hypothetical protein NEIMUCOT_03965 [Neisseria mucosa ATCC 25996]DAY27515.1 MAG TPA: hypothetical protein [Caudoviricetes sp.]
MLDNYVYTYIIQCIGAVKPDTGKAPPERGCYGRKKMKSYLQILFFLFLILVSGKAY